MRLLQPTENRRINEPVGFLLLILALSLGLGLVSYHPLDPSWNVAGGNKTPENLLGFPGAWVSDLALQWLGLTAFLLPVFLSVLGWRWLRSAELPAPAQRLAGTALLALVACAALALGPIPKLWFDTIEPGGVVGTLVAAALVAFLNEIGAVLVLLAAAILSAYLLSSFSLESTHGTFQALRAPLTAWRERFEEWRARQAERAQDVRMRISQRRLADAVEDASGSVASEPAKAASDSDEADALEETPIVPYEAPSSPAVRSGPEPRRLPFSDDSDEPQPQQSPAHAVENRPQRRRYRLPSTSLLLAPPERGTYDAAELRQLGGQIVMKFAEFGVKGSIVQINPGPVVTTYEFKPDPGIKYSRILQLTEDLCLALECESILVERIPGKSTVGIEVPNRKREIISLRECIEVPDFAENASFLTVALGKDISGRIRVADLTTMPHLLVAGSTGSGKSVLINTLVMSILMKATPEQVRFIMVDPKTVELGLYVDIPHLLTPVITDMKKASNALKNATREMERRLKLLAEYGVRNIDQYNRKIHRLNESAADETVEPLNTLPYIVIIIDELADLMILEGRAIEEAITRLAQMSRAVGIHLILATQRPSVDVITGLIKANIPARISFRLATRVDSRTILDSMGAEALLGRGDMLFLPPGTARMVRLHGPMVTEEEVVAAVDAWKEQGEPDYETAFLAPPAAENEEGEADDDEGFDDPAYQEALRIVLDMGKASTSTLQRRLRLGYGRAARILDAMEKDGIIGPPDGSRPREVLKRPDWLAEVQHR
jgi:S-DNA-T family DNA segregation ATPase FtsK/SpoIIIE